MGNRAVFLVLSAVFLAGCQGGPPGQMPPIGEEEGPGIGEHLTPYGKSLYTAVTHVGTYYDDRIVVNYILQDTNGYPVSDRKYGCVKLAEYPSGFEGEKYEYIYQKFDNGGITIRINTTQVGYYLFEFCGIMDREGEFYNNDGTYFGGGSEVEVYVTPYYFKVVNKSAEYEGGYINVEYQLNSETSSYPDEGKKGCIELTSYPQKFDPIQTDFMGTFEYGGVVRQSMESDVPGTYKFEFCGIYEYDEYFVLEEDGTYLGDGDEVSVEIEGSNIFHVINKSCEVWGDGPYGFECHWYFEFIDGSSGVCNAGPFMKDWEICFENYDRSEDEYYESCWEPLNCYGSYDYLKIIGTVSSGSTLTLWIGGINSTKIVYQGDGDEIVIET